MELSQDQKNAIATITIWKHAGMEQTIRLAGSAGTGKSFLISYILQNSTSIFGCNQYEIAIVTYTWKAALNLRAKGIAQARSIHSLFYRPLEKLDAVGKDAAIHDVNEKVQFIPVSPDELRSTYKLIIVDEASMLDVNIRRDIEALRIPVIYSGDHKQLPPIEKDNTKEFMADSEIILEKVHRQAEGSPIIRLSIDIANGKRIPYGKYGEGVYKITEDELSDNMLLNADMILCSKNITRNNINERVRDTLGYNTKHIPQVGEKLIVVTNNKELGYYNGEILKIKYNEEQSDTLLKHSGNVTFGISKFIDSKMEIDENENIERFYKLYFEKNTLLPLHNLTVDNNVRSNKVVYAYCKENDILQVDFGYCITVHKSQGDQYRKVIVFEERMGDNAFHKRLMYTAVTRAQDKLIIVK